MPAALCATVALSAVAALPGGTAVADDGFGTPAPYAYASDASTVEGGGSAVAAGRITLGHTYRSSIGPQGGTQGRSYYRIGLDAADDAYVSVTAVPRLGTEVAYGDGIKVTLQDSSGYPCSSDEARFGSADSPRPISAVATRTSRNDAAHCRQSGPYYLLVERNTDVGSTPDEWGLEIHSVQEPALRTAEPDTAPRTWNTTPAHPPAGPPVQRDGGSSFSTAGALEEGVWKDHVKPGETLYYSVPVAWGQQVFATAALTGAAGDGAAAGGAPGGHYVDAALVTALYNPVRGLVDSADTRYRGKEASATLRPLPPVGYRNRHSGDSRVSRMRLGGRYYLAVSLSPKLAEEFGDGAYQVTLTVAVRGAARQSPDYEGRPKPADAFMVTPPDQRTDEPGDTAAAPADDDAMHLLAAASFGTGTLLLLALALWTLLARRRVSGHAGSPPA